MARSVLLLVVLTACLAAVLLFYFRWLGDDVVGNGRSLQARDIYLQTYLTANADELEQPAGNGFTPAPFTIASGESADTIAANLAAAGLLNNTELFLNYLRFHGLDAQLEAGEYIIDPQQTIPQIAATLTEAVVQEETVRFVEGWRLEQMADYLADNPIAYVDATQFLAIAQRQAVFDLAPYPFLADLPPTATLEGYLFPDTYRLPPEADAAYLVDLMLRTFGQRVTTSMQQGFQAQGFTMHQAVTLAAIVEREAVVDAERPIIAGVFYNRLAQEMKLEADPTVQYPLGYQPESDSWWKSPLWLEDLELDSPYNTYRYTGLPPGPIANPSLSSLEAVAFPTQTDFIFFVADCEAAVAGSHAFSITYEEHLANVQRCR
ncbi:endolytic transglycosylase MltG [Candidatus Leptofilum sp.]|uniref:endolytic transglycosylase MltG n=1 Tax=Candidatus Leptofilum sp. TaxID=3241576 RepID=UPI003B5A09CB